jgi:hypothetical protein
MWMVWAQGVLHMAAQFRREGLRRGARSVNRVCSSGHSNSTRNAQDAVAYHRVKQMGRAVGNQGAGGA